MSGRVVVVGGYNVDMTVVSATLPMPGQTVLGREFHTGPGGKGSNQAIGARRLGAAVTLVVKVGADAFGLAARRLFESEGLSGPGILEDRTHTGVALVLVDDTGTNAISVAPGANARLTAQDVIGLGGVFDGATHLLCQLECGLDLFTEIAQHARRIGATTILDPSPAVRLPPEVLGLVDVLTPNEAELRVLTDLPTTAASEIERAARTLTGMGVEVVVVTLGERGAMRVTAGTSETFAPYAVRARDTTGSGDAFNAGLVTGLASGLPAAEAIRLGLRAGAFCATRLGVLEGLPTREQLDREVPG
ncbi:ribokinase [soil metagenome]|nr:ribokinase [Actinomycetota bacterium]